MGNQSDALNEVSDISESNPSTSSGNVSGDMSVTDSSGNTIQLGENSNEITTKDA